MKKANLSKALMMSCVILIPSVTSSRVGGAAYLRGASYDVAFASLVRVTPRLPGLPEKVPQVGLMFLPSNVSLPWQT